MEVEASRLHPEWVVGHVGSARGVFREVNHAGVGIRLKGPRDERGPVPQDWPSFSDVVHNILAVHSGEDFRSLARGELQHYVRHDVLIAAWGDFRRGTLHYDLLTADPGIVAVNAEAAGIAPILNQLFQGWAANGRKPLLMNTREYADAWAGGGMQAQAVPTMARMESVLVHGLLDQRGRHDCLYAFFSAAPSGGGDEAQALKLLVPYLDVALRQVEIPTRQATAPVAATAEEERPAPLSDREAEIMGWVALGKTNAEIGNILNLSSFTIKNHMQRIFKKLDVFNRAQAVSVFKSRHGAS